jgi:Sugar phosphate isomerases/epimerases
MSPSARATSPTPRKLGIDHLTLLGLTPPEMVTLAAEVGFDYVGLRVRPATAGESGYPMHPGSPMVKQTLALLDGTGVEVLDTEATTLDGVTSREDWLPALEVSAILGARFFSVIVADEDLSRAGADLAQLVEDAKGFAIRPSIEPITYRTIHSVPAAAELARTAPGAGVVIDALHFARFGGTVDEVVGLGDLLSWVQLCDGPASAPVGLRRPTRMPAGQSIEGTDLQVESRAVRGFPGEGEFLLRELLSALPASTPLAVETPNVDRATQMGPKAYAEAALLATRALLAELNSP